MNPGITFLPFNVTLYFCPVTSISNVFHWPTGFDAAVFEGAAKLYIAPVFEEDCRQALPYRQFESHILY